MAKDNYDIDNILSEVKKRREENERMIKGEDAPKATDDTNLFIIGDEPAPEPVSEPEFVITEDDAPAPVEEKVEAPVEEPATQDTEIEFGDAPAEEDILQTADEASNNEDMVDLLSYEVNEASDAEVVDQMYEYEEYPAQPTKKPKSKKSKILKRIICILLAVIIAIAGCAGVYVYKALNQITSGPNVPEKEWEGMKELVENFNPIQETDASQLASLKDMIKTWYYNGLPSSSSHVLNILLVGEDTRGSDILESGTRADSAMICSINADTHKIQLTSILRDTYAYWENTPGDESTGTFNKINAAMSLGDINVYKNAVERLYKVQIDYHIIVNFDSFEAIVDAMGGVTIEITDAEIREINNHQKRYNNVTINKTFEGNKGEMKLTGKQALAYCRIRKLDSDNMRANRQKICLNQIAKEAKNVSPTTLLKMADKLLPYIKTDMSKSTLLKIAKYALKQNWLDFETNSINMPDSRLKERGAGGNFKFAGSWIWKSDFPQDAYTVQTLIYGKSPITLAKTRVDYINCTETGFFSEYARPVTAVIYNQHYGEPTTLEPSTEAETDPTTVA